MNGQRALSLCGGADLHLHTNASDGFDSPRRVVKRAKAAGLSTIAITDHDTVEGLADAQDSGRKYGVEVIPGIELSTLDGRKEVHILGYFIDSAEPSLLEMLRCMIDARENRAIRMVEKLNTLGIHISLDRVREISGNAFLGRPHIAKALLEAGYVQNSSDAFTIDFIGSGGRAYVERFKLSTQEGIRHVAQAGGVAVLAHPGYLSDRSTLDEEEIARYRTSGLQGIEVFYSRHTTEQTEYYCDIAKRFDLLISGGSDCHGGTEPLMGRVRLGWNYVQQLKESRKPTD